MYFQLGLLLSLVFCRLLFLTSGGSPEASTGALPLDPSGDISPSNFIFRRLLIVESCLGVCGEQRLRRPHGWYLSKMSEIRRGAPRRAVVVCSCRWTRSSSSWMWVEVKRRPLTFASREAWCERTSRTDACPTLSATYSTIHINTAVIRQTDHSKITKLPNSLSTLRKLCSI